MTTINSTPAVADVVNTSSLIGDIFEETANPVRATEEVVVESTMAKKFSMEIKDAMVGDMNVRFVGDINILDLSGIAVVISSPPTNKQGKVVSPTPKRAIKIATQAAGWLAENNKAVFVGGLRGVDGYAIEEAISAGSKIAVFLPIGIKAIFETLKPEERKKFSDLIKYGRLLIISTRIKDTAPWSKEESAKRNTILAQCSDGILIPHMVGTWDSQEMVYTGGVMNLLNQAEEENIPVFAPAWRKGEHLFMGMLDRILTNITYLQDEDEHDNIFDEMIG